VSQHEQWTQRVGLSSSHDEREGSGATVGSMQLLSLARSQLGRRRTVSLSIVLSGGGNSPFDVCRHFDGSSTHLLDHHGGCRVLSAGANPKHPPLFRSSPIASFPPTPSGAPFRVPWVTLWWCASKRVGPSGWLSRNCRTPPTQAAHVLCVG